MLVRQRELYPSVTELLVSNLPFRGIVLDVRKAKAGTMLAFFFVLYFVSRQFRRRFRGM